LGRKEEAHQVLTTARIAAETLGSRRSLWPVLVSLSRLEEEQDQSRLAADLRRQVQHLLQFIASHARSPELRASFLALTPIRSVFE